MGPLDLFNIYYGGVMKYFTVILSSLMGLLFSFAAFGQTLTLDINGLQDLGSDFQYEGWIIVDGSPVSTGTFTVDGSGQLSETVFDVDHTDLINAGAFVLTIEPVPDPDPMPSSTHLLGGNFMDYNADLSTAHPAALGNDFMDIEGNYILATPTNGAMSNELSGIWFLDISSGTPAQGLFLPALPAGWKYEGWAVIDGMPVTTGKFTAPDMADESAPYSGTEPGPPFPGEDFLNNAPGGLTFPTDLSGMTGVISIEPDPDNSAAPFLLKPLAGAIPDPAMDHTTYAMNNNAANSFPTGTATRSDILPVELSSFTASVSADGVLLSWSTSTETNNQGFEIERSGSSSGSDMWTTIGFVKGHGTVTEANSYSFTDRNAAREDYSYRLKQIDLDGSFEYSNVVEIGYAGPAVFTLEQNYPNPFNPSTSISYSIPEDGFVNLIVYDVTGKEVRRLVSGRQQAGAHTVSFNAENLATGLYVYQLRTNKSVVSKKMLLLK